MHEAVFEQHDGLAIHWANQHWRPGADLEDLIQDARVGLLLAATRYDPDRGVRFSTYASYWIRNALQRGTANLVGALSAGEEARTQARALRRAADEAGLGARPERSAHVAERLGMPADAAGALLRVGQSAASIDELGGAEAGRYAVPAPDSDPAAIVEQRLERERIRRAVEGLEPEAAATIQHRYGFLGGCSNREELHKVTGIPLRRQRAVERQALDHLEVALA